MPVQRDATALAVFDRIVCGVDQTPESLEAARQAKRLRSLSGLDVLAFSGGVGENRADVRAAVSGRLRFLGEFRVEVVPAREELVIAGAVRTLLG